MTDGMRIYARVSRRGDGALRVDGGEGVGRVTRPGLDQPPGAAAINSTPRRMIAGQLAEALREAGASGGLEAVIPHPAGLRWPARPSIPAGHPGRDSPFWGPAGSSAP